MAAATALFQTFSNGSRVVLNSGNIADLSKLRKKVSLTSTQEVRISHGVTTITESVPLLACVSCREDIG